MLSALLDELGNSALTLERLQEIGELAAKQADEAHAEGRPEAEALVVQGLVTHLLERPEAAYVFYRQAESLLEPGLLKSLLPVLCAAAEADQDRLEDAHRSMKRLDPIQVPPALVDTAALHLELALARRALAQSHANLAATHLDRVVQTLRTIESTGPDTALRRVLSRLVEARLVPLP